MRELFHRREHSVSEELNISDRAELKELEKENRELRLERELLKKSRCLQRLGTVNEKFAFIAAEKADPNSPHPVIKRCTWLQVSTSGFYDYLNAVDTTQQARRAKVALHVQTAHKADRGAYGVRRVHAVLARSLDADVASCSLADPPTQPKALAAAEMT